jgi:hypothetical protein
MNTKLDKYPHWIREGLIVNDRERRNQLLRLEFDTFCKDRELRLCRYFRHEVLKAGAHDLHDIYHLDVKHHVFDHLLYFGFTARRGWPAALMGFPYCTIKQALEEAQRAGFNCEELPYRWYGETECIRQSTICVLFTPKDGYGFNRPVMNRTLSYKQILFGDRALFRRRS